MKRIILFMVIVAVYLAACGQVQVTNTIPVQTETTRIVSTPSPTIQTPDPTTTDEPASVPTNAATSAATSAPISTPSPQKSLFLISWDGARADVVNELIASGEMPVFANLAANGLRAEYARSVDPSLTAPAHSSIATGCYPSRTGIVSNAYHHPSDSFYWYRDGFDEPLDDAEPVWVTASRAGLTSAAVFFPGASPDKPWQTADYTIGYGVRDAYSRQLDIELAPAEDGWDRYGIVSYSQPYEGSFTIPEVARVFVYLVDSSDDSIANHDTVLLSTARQVSTGTPSLATGQWVPLVLDSNRYSGADFLIQGIDLDPGAPQVSLYHSGVHHNIASPRQLLESLNQEYGFFPAGADQYALEHGWISEYDFMHMLERAALWQAAVSAWVFDTYQPDLLVTWQNNFDAAGHAFFLRDPSQPGYTPELASQYAQHSLSAAQVSDQALDIMLDVIDLDTTTLMMVSDHGMAPVHTTVYVNTILESAGLLKLDSSNYVVVDQSQAFAVCSGGSTHIYINLQGYQRDGFVTQEQYSIVQSTIIETLTSVTDPESGEPVFARVLPARDLGALGIHHPLSGDVFAQANLGYALDCYRGRASVFDSVGYYGQHGYDSTLVEMQGMFIAAGGELPRSGATIPAIHLVDLAPTIARILGFQHDPRVEGSAIPALVEK